MTPVTSEPGRIAAAAAMARRARRIRLLFHAGRMGVFPLLATVCRKAQQLGYADFFSLTTIPPAPLLGDPLLLKYWEHGQHIGYFLEYERAEEQAERQAGMKSY